MHKNCVAYGGMQHVVKMVREICGEGLLCCGYQPGIMYFC